MSQEVVGIGEPSPTGISDQERCWAILKWLSAKQHDASPVDVLEAATSFEEFVAGEVAGQKLSKEALSKIEKVEATVGKIATGTVEPKSDFEDLVEPL